MESLALYDVATLGATPALDLGTVAPGSSDDSSLRVLNNSTLYQADDVSVTVSAPLLVSADGDSFFPSIILGDISPGGLSSVFTLRRVTATTATAGPAAGQLTLTPAAWSGFTDTSSSANTPIDTEDGS